MKHILHWIEFPFFMQESAPSTQNTTKSNEYEDHAVLALNVWARQQPQAGVGTTLSGSAQVRGLLGGQGVRVSRAFVRQSNGFCVCEAAGGSWPGHSASLLSWATAARAELEQPGQGGVGLRRQGCSCCVWFPLRPGDLDKRVAFID